MSTSPPSSDTHTELLAALETQDARRTWILEHWPHIVEHTQVRAALVEPATAGAPVADLDATPRPPSLRTRGSHS